MARYRTIDRRCTSTVRKACMHEQFDMGARLCEINQWLLGHSHAFGYFAYSLTAVGTADR